MSIDGDPCVNLAARVEDGTSVEVDGKKVQPKSPMLVLLYKPSGYTTTAQDERGRKTIYDLLPEDWRRLKYAGRLDRESEGLVVLSNDGDLVNRITHPRHGWEKEYFVVLDKPFRREWTRRLLDGIAIEDGLARAVAVDFLTRKRLTMTLKQGMKRQIRRMFEALGYEVKSLERTRVGPFALGELAIGKWRVATASELAAARKQL